MVGVRNKMNKQVGIKMVTINRFLFTARRRRWNSFSKKLNNHTILLKWNNRLKLYGSRNRLIRRGD